MRKYIEIINEATAYKAPMRIHASRLTGRLMNLKPRMSELEGKYLLKDLAMLCETILEWCEHRGEVSMAMKQAVMQAKAYFPQTVEMCMTNPHVPRNVRDGIQLIRDELKNFNVVLEGKHHESEGAKLKKAVKDAQARYEADDSEENRKALLSAIRNQETWEGADRALASERKELNESISAEEKVKWMSRQAKRFMAAEPDFDASIEYESDLDGLVLQHPSWVTSEDDLTPLGKAVRSYLKAHPHLIDEA